MLKERLSTVLETLIEILPKCENFGGICDVLEDFVYTDRISDEERNYIIKFLERNKPTVKNKYKELAKSIYWTKNQGFGYWWNPMFEYNETIQIRIDYLKTVIKVNKLE